MKKLVSFLLILALAFCAALPVLAGETAAAAVVLERAEGDVAITDEAGLAVSYSEGQRLYSGYTITTAAASYAYLSLDDHKAVKLDSSSRVEVQKHGRKLELYVSSGNLFFNVKEPLEDDETLLIRTAAMVADIRGTSGWIETLGQDASAAYLFTGELSLHGAAANGTGAWDMTLQSGQQLQFNSTADGGKPVNISPLSEDQVLGFVAVELKDDDKLLQRVQANTDLNVGEIINDADARLESDQQNGQNDEFPTLQTQQITPLFPSIATTPVSPPEPPAIPVHLSYEGVPAITSYTYGEAFEMTGLRFWVDNSDGTQTDVTYGVKAEPMKVGDTSVICYMDEYRNLKNLKPPYWEVKGITVAQANPLSGNVTFVGLQLYTDHTLEKAAKGLICGEQVPGEFTLQGDPNETLTSGKTEYAWTFTPEDSNYKTVSGTIMLTVYDRENPPVSLTAEGTPAKTSYIYGESFETTGLTVKLRYKNGNTEDVTDQVKIGKLTVGESVSVKLSYLGFECQVAGITVNQADPQLSAVTYDETKGPLYTDDTLDELAKRLRFTAGVLVKLKLEGKLEFGSQTFTWTIAPIDKGYQTVSGTIELFVYDRVNPPVSLSVEGTPAKTSYTYGENFDAAGLTVTLHYKNGNTEDVTQALDTVQLLTVGTGLPITLTYGKLSCQVEGITVEKAPSGVTLQDMSAVTVPAGANAEDMSALLTEYLVNPLGLGGTLSATAPEDADTGAKFTWTFTPVSPNHTAASGELTLRWTELALSPDADAAAITGAYRKTNRVVLSSGKTTLAADMTIPAGKTLAIASGAELEVNSGRTLTVNGRLEIRSGGSLLNRHRIIVQTGSELTVSGTLISAIDARDYDSTASITAHFASMKKAGIENNGTVTLQDGAALTMTADYANTIYHTEYSACSPQPAANALVNHGTVNLYGGTITSTITGFESGTGGDPGAVYDTAIWNESAGSQPLVNVWGAPTIRGNLLSYYASDAAAAAEINVSGVLTLEKHPLLSTYLHAYDSYFLAGTFHVQDGGTLNVKGITAGAASGGPYGAIQVEDGGTFHLSDNATIYNVPIRIDDGGTFTVKDSKLSSALDGPAIDVAGSGKETTVTMTDSTIHSLYPADAGQLDVCAIRSTGSGTNITIDCAADGAAEIQYLNTGFCIKDGSTLTLNGGTVYHPSDCLCTDACGVYIEGGTFRMTGGELAGAGNTCLIRLESADHCEEDKRSAAYLYGGKNALTLSSPGDSAYAIQNNHSNVYLCGSDTALYPIAFHCVKAIENQGGTVILKDGAVLQHASFQSPQHILFYNHGDDSVIRLKDCALIARIVSADDERRTILYEADGKSAVYLGGETDEYGSFNFGAYFEADGIIVTAMDQILQGEGIGIDASLRAGMYIDPTDESKVSTAEEMINILASIRESELHYHDASQEIGGTSVDCHHFTISRKSTLEP